MQTSDLLSLNALVISIFVAFKSFANHLPVLIHEIFPDGHNFRILNVNRGVDAFIEFLVNQSVNKDLIIKAYYGPAETKVITTSEPLTLIGKLIPPDGVFKIVIDYQDRSRAEPMRFTIERDSFNFFHPAPKFHVVLRKPRSKWSPCGFLKDLRAFVWRRLICSYKL